MPAEVVNYHHINWWNRRHTGKGHTFVRHEIPDLGNVLFRPEPRIILVLTKQHRRGRGRFRVFRGEQGGVLGVDPDRG